MRSFCANFSNEKGICGVFKKLIAGISWVKTVLTNVEQQLDIQMICGFKKLHVIFELEILKESDTSGLTWSFL